MLWSVGEDSLNEIGTYSTTTSLINLSAACKYAFGLFKPHLFQKLQKYLVRGAQKQVEFLLKFHPEYVDTHCKETEISYFGVKYVNPTPLQLARALGDIEMCHAIIGEKPDLLNQIDHFPATLVDKNNTYDFSAIITAIDTNTNVPHELDIFRNHIDTIVKEKGFPFQALLDSYQTCDSKNPLWTQQQWVVFNICVIGYLQRVSPHWFRQALTSGLNNIVKKKKVCDRDFLLQNLENKSIDPASDIANEGLGFSHCINIFGCARNCVNWQEMGSVFEVISQFFNLQETLLLDLLSKKNIMQLSI